jgi:hypothetical protein
VFELVTEVVRLKDRFIGKWVGVEQKNEDEGFRGKSVDTRVDCRARRHCVGEGHIHVLRRLYMASKAQARQCTGFKCDSG